MTVAQAATTAGVSARTVRRALAAGLLAGHQAAGRWRVTTADLERWRAAGAPTTSTPGPATPARRTATPAPRPDRATQAILGRPPRPRPEGKTA
jgi:excisionase family DNA binding protein